MANSHRNNTITAQAFARLGGEKQLQEYSKIIFQLLGLVIDFISADGETLRISRGVNFNSYCAALRATPAGREICSKCDMDHARAAAAERKNICYACSAGLHEILVPLFDSRGEYIGAMTSGQFHLDGQPLFSRENVAELARGCGLDPEKMWKLYRRSITLSALQAEGVTGYLEIIGRHLTGIRENLILMDRIDTPDKVAEIKKYVEKNCMHRLTVEQVSRKFYLSPDYLSHLFSRKVHVSFHRYLALCRIIRARNMLAETSLSASEIAYASGFGSISQFNRAFKAETGRSPGAYRRAERGRAERKTLEKTVRPC
ncbi:MAG: PocR ligand-binding domain-containing protein [Lentisphaeria bacterium]|nr:PocR ligand-binding domain-containing protein [Lentisphaeria bacterium]